MSSWSRSGPQAQRGRTTEQTNSRLGSRPSPNRRLSAHIIGPPTLGEGRPLQRRSQSHEPRHRSAPLSSPFERMETRGRARRSPQSPSLQSPSTQGRPSSHLGPSGFRRDSYGPSSPIPIRLLRDEVGPNSRERRYSFSPGISRPSPRSRTFSSDRPTPTFRPGDYGVSPTSRSPLGSINSRRADTPPRRPNLRVEGQTNSPRRYSSDYGKPRSSSARGQGIQSPRKHSSREPSRGRRGNLLGTLATVAGIEGLVKHVNTAQQWTDWLSDLQDSPDEIRSLADKAHTARDTVSQIEATLAARPDLLEGETGQRLKQHIEDAVGSTNETLTVMTGLLSEISVTTAEEGTVLRGLQEYWNSYRYKNEWGGKLKEVEARLQGQLAQLGTLMINVYSRALTKPVPATAAETYSHYPHGVSPDLPSKSTSGDGSGEVKAPASSKSEVDTTVDKSDANGKHTSESIDVPKLASTLPIDPATGGKEGSGPGVAGHTDSQAQHVRPTQDATSWVTGGNPAPMAAPELQATTPIARESNIATIDSAVAEDEDHVEQLLDAAWDGNLEAVTRAIQHAPPQSRDSSGMTALHLAAERDHLAVAMFLLDQGVDANLRAERARTALHLAARSASADMVEMLLERAGADVDARTSDGKTPLHYAASSAADGKEDRREVLRVLREWNADPTLKDRKGDTARDVAQKRDHWDAAATLRRTEKRWEEKHRQNWLQRHGLSK